MRREKKHAEMSSELEDFAEDPPMKMSNRYQSKAFLDYLISRFCL
jgi:hypothetical protein